MLNRPRKRWHRDERGITGLETAIILIAFVVVASVFAYTILSAGIFSAEKGKEAVYSGLDTARSSMMIAGPVLAEDTDSDGDVDTLTFIVTNVLEGEATNFTATIDGDSDGVLWDEPVRNHTTVITYTDENQRHTDIVWTASQIGKGDGDVLMETGEKFEVVVTLTQALTTPLDENDTFMIEVKPAKGSALAIERTIPPTVDVLMDLR